MARPERTVDPAGGPVAEFATALRALRRDAGSPPYRVLAQRSHYSATALSQAAAGTRLPRLEVTLAYVDACGGNRDEWQARWTALANEQGSPTEAPTGTAVDEWAGTPPARANHRWRRTLAVSAACAVVVVAAVLLAQLMTSRPGSPPARATVTALPALLSIKAHDGADPKDSGCAVDATTIASAPLQYGTITLGIVELRYSPHCVVGWARYTPAIAGTQHVQVTTIRPADNLHSVYTVTVNNIAAFADIARTGRGCVLASATVTAVVDNSTETAHADTSCRSGP